MPARPKSWIVTLSELAPKRYLGNKSRLVAHCYDDRAGGSFVTGYAIPASATSRPSRHMAAAMIDRALPMDLSISYLRDDSQLGRSPPSILRLSIVKDRVVREV